MPPQGPAAERRRRGLFPTLLVGLLLTGVAVPAGQPANALQLKTAFILNFLQFVDWPGDRSTTRSIGVLGDDGLAAALTDTSRQTVPDGVEVTVRRLTRAEDARSVQLLFIGAAEQPHLPAILRDVDGLPVLTVGDTLGFAKAGVMLNLYTFDQRVRIEVNTAATARAQLKLSSHLLRLARIVE